MHPHAKTRPTRVLMHPCFPDAATCALPSDVFDGVPGGWGRGRRRAGGGARNTAAPPHARPLCVGTHRGRAVTLEASGRVRTCICVRLS